MSFGGYGGRPSGFGPPTRGRGGWSAGSASRGSFGRDDRRGGDRRGRGRGSRERGDRPRQRIDTEHMFIRPKGLDPPNFFGCNTIRITDADPAVNLNNEAYTSYKHLGRVCRELLSTTAREAFLSGDPQKLLLNVLMFGHPEAPQKMLGSTFTGNPEQDSEAIKGNMANYRIQVDEHPDFPGTNCFFIVRPDSTREDFSFRKALKSLFPFGAQKRVYNTDVQGLEPKTGVMYYWRLEDDSIFPPRPERPAILLKSDNETTKKDTRVLDDDTPATNEAKPADTVTDDHDPIGAQGDFIPLKNDTSNQQGVAAPGIHPSRLAAATSYSDPAMDPQREARITARKEYRQKIRDWELVCQKIVRDRFTKQHLPVLIEHNFGNSSGICRFFNPRDGPRAMQAVADGIVQLTLLPMEPHEEAEWWERRAIEMSYAKEYEVKAKNPNYIPRDPNAPPPAERPPRDRSSGPPGGRFSDRARGGSDFPPRAGRGYDRHTSPSPNHRERDLSPRPGGFNRAPPPPHEVRDDSRGRTGFEPHRSESPRGYPAGSHGGFDQGGLDSRGGYDASRGGFDGGRGGGYHESGRGSYGGYHDGGRDTGYGSSNDSGRFESARGGYNHGERGSYGDAHRGFDGGRGGYDNGQGNYDSGRGGYDGGRGGFDSNRGGYNDSARGGYDGGRGGFSDGSRGGYGGRGFDNHPGKYGSYDSGYGDGGRGGYGDGGRGGYGDGGRGGYGDGGRGGYGDGGRGGYGDGGRGGYGDGGRGGYGDGGRGGYGDGGRGGYGDGGRGGYGDGGRGGYGDGGRGGYGDGRGGYGDGGRGGYGDGGRGYGDGGRGGYGDGGRGGYGDGGRGGYGDGGRGGYGDGGRGGYGGHDDRSAYGGYGSRGGYDDRGRGGFDWH